MRCSYCGYELGAKGPKLGEIVPCPICRSEVVGELLPSVGVEPLPPKRGSSSLGGTVWLACKIGGVILFGLVVVACLLPVRSTAREAANRSSCSNNLKQIAIALHNYHDMYKAFPAQSVTDGNGRPMHSWRIAILPFIEASPLYDRYDFDQPWDSPYNRDVCRVPMPVYRCPSSDIDRDSNLTSYFVVYGDETMFAPDRWLTFSDMTDGTRNTIMVVECESEAMCVQWSEPRDLPFDQMSFKINSPDGIGVSSGHPGGAQVVYGDGHVQYLSDQLDESTFRYLLIRNDGKDVQAP